MSIFTLVFPAKDCLVKASRPEAPESVKHRIEIGHAGVYHAESNYDQQWNHETADGTARAPGDCPLAIELGVMLGAGSMLARKLRLLRHCKRTAGECSSDGTGEQCCAPVGRRRGQPG